MSQKISCIKSTSEVVKLCNEFTLFAEFLLNNMKILAKFQGSITNSNNFLSLSEFVDECALSLGMISKRFNCKI